VLLWACFSFFVILVVLFVILLVSVVAILGFELGLAAGPFDDLFGVLVGGDLLAVFVEDGVGDDVVLGGPEVAGVGAGDLEAVEHDGGSFGVKAVAAEGEKEHGESDLDGFAVVEGGEVELDGAAGVGEVLGDEGVALEVAGSEVEGWMMVGVSSGGGLRVRWRALTPRW
jgi:hypothetical protein